VLIEHGRLSEEYTLEILLPLVDALEKAHQLGIVHRDFKPENIMLTVDDYGDMSPKLLDFGVAEILRDKRSRDLSDNGNVIMGTPEYMSPEQARDESHMVGPHSDVWGVGVVWYECLTGRVPFSGDSAVDVLTAVCDSPVDFEPVPEAYVPLLRDALGRTPNVRIATLSDFKARIEDMGVVESGPPAAPAPLASVPPPSVSGESNLTPTGLGPEVLSSAERTSIAADAELEIVPVRSHRKALLGGFALAVVVAVSAWWTVRDRDQETVPPLKPAIAEHDVLEEQDELAAVPSEPLPEASAQLADEVAAQPNDEVAAEPAAEPAEEVVADTTDEVVAEPAAEPVEELVADATEEVVAEPSEAVVTERIEEAPAEAVVEPAEVVTISPEPEATRSAARKPRRESTPVRRRKSSTPARTRNKKPPELVTEW
jgi:serine/threonine-protein kinase